MTISNFIVNFLLIIYFGLPWSILDVVNCIIFIAAIFQKSAQILNVDIISYFAEIVYLNKKK